MSPRLLDGVVRLGSRLPFAQAAELVGFFWGVFVSADTVRRATERAGAALAAAEAQELCRLEREFPAPGTPHDERQLDRLIHGFGEERAALGVGS